jgi:hypothetical protein
MANGDFVKNYILNIHLLISKAITHFLINLGKQFVTFYIKVLGLSNDESWLIQR